MLTTLVFPVMQKELFLNTTEKYGIRKTLAEFITNEKPPLHIEFF